MRPDVACHPERQAEGELQVAACQARPAGSGTAGASPVTVTVAQVLVAVSPGATAPAPPAQPLQSPVICAGGCPAARSPSRKARVIEMSDTEAILAAELEASRRRAEELAAMLDQERKVAKS